jgi:hypothetical protein
VALAARAQQHERMRRIGVLGLLHGFQRRAEGARLGWRSPPGSSGHGSDMTAARASMSGTSNSPPEFRFAARAIRKSMVASRLPMQPNNRAAS